MLTEYVEKSKRLQSGYFSSYRPSSYLRKSYMSNNHSGRIVSNFIALSVIQGANFLLPLLVMPFVIKRIGTDGFGLVSIAQVVMIYLSAIADYGFNLTATRDVAVYRTDRQKISQIFFTTLGTKLLISICLFVILVVVIFLIPLFRQHVLLYILGFVYVIGQSLTVSWFFQGMERMQFITIVTLLARMVFVALVFLFIRQKNDYIFFLFFLGLGNVLAGFVSIFLAIKIFKLTYANISRANVMEEIRGGWQLTISNLSINTFLYSNIFILRLFTNDTIVGLYSVAEKIFFALRQVLAVFSQAIYPHLCQLAFSAKEKLPGFFRKVYLPFLFIVIAACTVLFFCAHKLIHLFLPQSSGLPALLLQMFSFVPLIVCLNIPAYQLLLAFNKKKAYSMVFGLGVIVNLFSNVVLCNSWGATGTVISIILTESFITVGLTWLLQRSQLFYLVTGKHHKNAFGTETASLSKSSYEKE
jgi:PST family polysaccharide transporter